MQQLSFLGDSQAVRMCRTYGPGGDDQCAESGATTQRVKVLVRHGVNQLLDTCLLMVGVNDLSKGLSLDSACKNVKVIIGLVTRSGRRLFLVTLPPTKFKKPEINMLVQRFNSYLLSFQGHPAVRVIRFHSKFPDFQVDSVESLMENRYRHSHRRDKVHVSREGHLLILEEVKKFQSRPTVWN